MQTINTNSAHSTKTNGKVNQARLLGSQPSFGQEERPLDLSLFGSRKRPAPIGLAAVASRLNGPPPVKNNNNATNLTQQILLQPSPLSITPSHLNEPTFIPQFATPPAPFLPQGLPPPFCFFPTLPNWSPPQLQQMNLPVPLAVLQQAAALGDLQALTYAQNLQRSAILASLANQSSKSAQKLNIQQGNTFVDHEVGMRGPFQSPPMTKPPPPKIPRPQQPPVVAQHQHQQHHQMMTAQLQQTRPVLSRPSTSSQSNANGTVVNGNSWSEDTVRSVNTCLICRASFESMNSLTAHMAETKHFRNFHISSFPPPNVRRISNSNSAEKVLTSSPSDMRVGPQVPNSLTVTTPPLTPVDNKRQLAPQFQVKNATGQAAIRDTPVFPTPSILDDSELHIDVVGKFDDASCEDGINNTSVTGDGNGRQKNQRSSIDKLNSPLTKLCQFASSPIKVVALTMTTNTTADP